MKRGVIVFICLFLMISLSFVSAECSDTDGGINYNQRGNVVGNDMPYEDRCSYGNGGEDKYNNSKNWLYEAYCFQDKNPSSAFGYGYEYYFCPNGCEDAACVQVSEECSDTDGGINYNQRGNVVGNDMPYEDRCSYGNGGEDKYNNSKNWLYEAYCFQDKNPSSAFGYGYEYYFCPNGCEDAACVQVSEECSDTDGGINYNQRGNVVGNDMPYEDRCSYGNGGEDKYNNSKTGYMKHTVFKTKNPSSAFGYGYEYYFCPNGCEDAACVQIQVGRTITEKEGIYTCKQETESQIICGLIFTTEPLEIVGKTFLINSIDNKDELSLNVDGKILNNLKVGNSYNLGNYNLYVEDIDYDSKNPLATGVKFSLTLSNSTDSEPKEIGKLVCEFGCPFEDKCYPFGYRKSGRYCSDNSEFLGQVESEDICENNFECKSNLCIDSQCVSEGLMKKILNWFKNLFG